MTDAHVRHAALHVDRHVLLQAPAGSGKTTVLSQRFLHALAMVEEPEQVLAITFTRKAAAEMRERVLAALEGAIAETQPDHATWSAAREAVRAQAARRGWNMAEMPQRLRIQTIDSLAHEVARTMPLLGRMQGSLQVVDDAAPMYREAARRTLVDGESDARLQPDIDRLLRRLDNNVDQAQQLLAELLPGRNRWLPWLVGHRDDALAERVSASLERIVRASLEQALEAMPRDWWQQAAMLARDCANHREAASHAREGDWSAWLAPGAALDASPGSLACWRAVIELLLTAEGELRKPAGINVRLGFPPTDKALKSRWLDWYSLVAAREDVLAALSAIRLLPPALVDEEERSALAGLSRVMLRAAAELKVAFRDAGLVDHPEIGAIARQALDTGLGLGEDTLRHALRISHLLVDEFQDTSPEQLALVQALTRHWEHGDGRSLFFVGDPMQSIYLFRNSEVGLFLQVRAGGVGGISLEAMNLTRNFRSQPRLVEWSNRVFEGIFPRVEDLRRSAVTFLAAQAARGEDADAGAEVEVLPWLDDDAAAEARAIAARIASLRAAQPDSSIAVLVQARAHAGPLLHAMRAAGVPVIGVDLAALAERPVVRDLVALGQALLDAGDRAAWLAVLRSPAVGLSLADLLQLCEAMGPGPLVERLAEASRITVLSEDARLRLQRAAPLLHEAWRARGSLDIAANIERCWHGLGGSAACRDTHELATARQYLLALRNLQEREGQLAPARLSELARGLRDQGAPTAANPVEVLTIHHAKGLEWDVVFVPGMGRRVGTGGTPLLQMLELPTPDGESDLLLAVRSLGRPNASDPLARYIRSLQAGRQLNERLRLLYVATTRAKSRLYLSGHALPDRNGQPRPRSGSLLQLMWPAVAQDFTAAAAAMPAPQAAEEAGPLPMSCHRLPADFVLPAAPSLPTVQSLVRALSDPDAVEDVEFSWVGPLARAAGIVMHAELERLALKGEEGVPGIAAREAACAARLRELGIPASRATRTAREIIERLLRLALEARARWLLFTPHRGAASELRLTGFVDGELRNAVIDRSFIDEAGTRWIVDYKTSQHAGGGLAEFIERELARYAPQLRLYAQLARGLGPEPVRAALYFPWLGEFRELPQA
jgi:ATP-dependent exoDNAse (exonuclease V) beta subunit